MGSFRFVSSYYSFLLPASISGSHVLPCFAPPAMPCHAMPRAYAAIGPLETGLRTLPHVPQRLIGYLCVFIFIFGFYPVSHAIWIYDVCIMICTCVCGSAALGIGNSSIIEESVYLFPPFFNFSSSASYSTTCVLPTYLIT